MDQVNWNNDERVDIPDMRAVSSLQREHLSRIINRLLGARTMNPGSTTAYPATGTFRQPVILSPFKLTIVSGLTVKFTRSDNSDATDALVWDRDGVFICSPASVTNANVTAPSSNGTYYACVKRGGTFPTDAGVAGVSANRRFWDSVDEEEFVQSVNTRLQATWTASIQTADPTTDATTADAGWVRIGTVTVVSSAVTVVSVDATTQTFQARAFFNSLGVADVRTFKDAFDAITDSLANITAPNSATDARKWGVRIADALDDANLTAASGYTKPASIRSAASRARGIASITVAGTSEDGDFTSLPLAVAKCTLLGSGTGGVIYLRPGIYDVSTTLTVPPNVTIIGAGPQESVIRWTGSAAGTAVVLQQNAYQGARLENCRLFDATIAASVMVRIDSTASSIVAEGVTIRSCFFDTGATTTGISITGSNAPANIRIDDCVIVAATTAILGAGTSLGRTTIERCLLSAASGIYVSHTTVTDLTINNCDAVCPAVTGNAGFRVEPGTSQTRSRYTDLRVVGSAVGFSLYNVVSGEIDDCSVDGCAASTAAGTTALEATINGTLSIDGFRATTIGSAGVSTTNAYGMIISGNNAGTQLSLSDVVIQDLIPKTSGSTKTYGVAVNAITHLTMQGIEIVNNTASYQTNAAQSCGLLVYDCLHGTIDGVTTRRVGGGDAAVCIGDDGGTTVASSITTYLSMSNLSLRESTGVGLWVKGTVEDFTISGGYVQASNEAVKVDPNGGTIGPGLITGLLLDPGATAGVNFVTAGTRVRVKCSLATPGGTVPMIAGTPGATTVTNTRTMSHELIKQGDTALANIAPSAGSETVAPNVYYVGPIPFPGRLRADSFGLATVADVGGLNTVNNEAGIRIKVEKIAGVDGSASNITVTNNEPASPYRDGSGFQNIFSYRRQASAGSYTADSFGYDTDQNSLSGVMISRARDPDSIPATFAAGDFLRVTMQAYGFKDAAGLVENVVMTITRATLTVKYDADDEDL